MNDYEKLIANLKELVIKLTIYRDKIASIISEEEKIKKHCVNTKEIIAEDICKKREIANLINDEEYSRYTLALKMLIGLVSFILGFVVWGVLSDKFLLLGVKDWLLVAISLGSALLFGRVSYLISTKKYRLLREQYNSESLEKEIANLLSVKRKKEKKISLINQMIAEYNLEKEQTVDELNKFLDYQIEMINNNSLLMQVTDGSVSKMNEAFQKDSKAQEVLKLVRTKKEHKDKGEIYEK